MKRQQYLAQDFQEILLEDNTIDSLKENIRVIAQVASQTCFFLLMKIK